MSIANDLCGVRACLLGEALEQEKANQKTRAWAVLFFTISGGLFCGLGILPLMFSKAVFTLPLVDAWWYSEWVAPVASAIPGALGWMAWIISGSNPIISDLTAQEKVKIESGSSVWDNLPLLGNKLLVVFGSIIAVSAMALILRIGYKLIV